jgi:hypothetical protein
VASFSDAAEARRREGPAPANDRPDGELPEPDVGPHWPAWKVTTLVVLFCGAFWGTVIWAGMRLFGG